MKIHTFEQGSPEWFMGRLGIPTASRFDEIMTPKQLKPVKDGGLKYMGRLMAEWYGNQPVEDWSNSIVERGTGLEDDGRRWYSLVRDVDVQQVGFLTRDDGKVGGSPDGLVGTEGVLEIKNYMVVNQWCTLLGQPHEHIGQIQGYLYLTDRAWCDLCCYNPEHPSEVIRVDRDENWQKAFVPILDEFIGRMDEAKKKYAEGRILRPWMIEGLS